MKETGKKALELSGDDYSLYYILGTACMAGNYFEKSVEYIENLILLLGSSILIWLYGIGNKDNTLKRSNGVILLIIYIIYSIRLFI